MKVKCCPISTYRYEQADEQIIANGGDIKRHWQAQKNHGSRCKVRIILIRSRYWFVISHDVNRYNMLSSLWMFDPTEHEHTDCELQLFQSMLVFRSIQFIYIKDGLYSVAYSDDIPMLSVATTFCNVHYHSSIDSISRQVGFTSSLYFRFRFHHE